MAIDFGYYVFKGLSLFTEKEKEMIKVTTEVFQTNDGKVFTNEKEALEHESKLQAVKYFEIHYGADLTEGRSWLENVGVVAVNVNGSHLYFLEIFCYKMFGSKHQFCQGVFGNNAIIPYWSIGKEVFNPTKVHFAVEERFAKHKIYTEGMWDLRGVTPKQIKY